MKKTLTEKYHVALRREMALYRQRGYRFSGIYVGGGTPTVLMDELSETLRLAREMFPITSISVETNPNHLTDANIRHSETGGCQSAFCGSADLRR
ncbi:MAG: hypothetical protein MZU91_09965 [Desulfosudis oleivorans]|nr:hypothetical protein [Desulfosudis oleivorans]